MIRVLFGLGIGSPPGGTLYGVEFDLGPGPKYILNPDNIDVAGEYRRGSRTSCRTTGRALPVPLARAVPI